MGRHYWHSRANQKRQELRANVLALVFQKKDNPRFSLFFCTFLFLVYLIDLDTFVSISNFLRFDTIERRMSNRLIRTSSNSAILRAFDAANLLCYLVEWTPSFVNTERLNWFTFNRCNSTMLSDNRSAHINVNCKCTLIFARWRKNNVIR